MSGFQRERHSFYPDEVPLALNAGGGRRGGGGEGNPPLRFFDEPVSLTLLEGGKLSQAENASK